ncbi:universal stress protein [Mangrovimonas sp. TPBH4]|uniref:universal stress protein n=1 Tax=Mangrovimonas sp. TPBH4 TaxID=1645914 RepID=UPI0006B55045|nr:universal stress protein [Mangrovimonas sp. TPBH4]
MKYQILLPTDFSDNAWNATVYALKLFAEEECTFYLLHSKNEKVSAMANMSKKYNDVLRSSNLKELTKLKETVEATNDNPNHTFEIILSAGSLGDSIEAYIKKYHINLIVMGTKGASGAKGLLFGSNTVGIIGRIKCCPILAIPDKSDFVPPKQIAFPTDYNRFYSPTEMGAIKNIAELFNSKINVVHINTEAELTEIQSFNVKAIKEYMQDFDHSFHWMPHYAKKATEINDFVGEHNIDMLAMVSYQHSFYESLTREPVIKKIGSQLKVPFLIIPESKH